VNQEELTVQAFDIVYERWTNAEKTNKEINFIQSIIQNGRIIDIGCGTGRHLIPLMRKGYTMIGIEPLQGMIKILKQKLPDGSANLELFNGTIQDVPLVGKYDGAICYYNAFTQVAQSDEEAEYVVEKLMEHLTDGAIIIQLSNPHNIDFHTFNYESCIEKDGVTYDATYKITAFDDKTNITTSIENIKITENGKTNTVSATITQKWWYKDDFERLFSDYSLEFFDENGEKFRVNNQEMVVVMRKNGTDGIFKS
jgi:2-polyprenyl-3-methyl-5-hydroxy-6-metoxy-1,4-benzoquinol methylase